MAVLDGPFALDDQVDDGLAQLYFVDDFSLDVIPDTDSVWSIQRVVTAANQQHNVASVQKLRDGNTSSQIYTCMRCPRRRRRRRSSSRRRRRRMGMGVESANC